MQAEKGSPEYWLGKLYSAWSKRQPELNKLKDYYDGDHPLPFATGEWRKEFSRMMASVSDNWMALVVDAVEERLHVEGFRIGEDPQSDDDAWKIWQENHLDSDSELVHSASLWAGSAAAMVWPSDESVEISVEDPMQIVVAYEPGSRRRRRAALKIWRDEWTDEQFANVYLSDGIYKFKSTSKQTSGLELATKITWVRRDEDVENPFGVVPIVELINRPQLTGGGRSEIIDVLSAQDQINKLVCDMMIASEFGAFRQRWATGIEIPTDDEGKEIEVFEAAIDRMWHVPDVDAKFGEFEQTDLKIYVAAIENRIQSLASRTRTPPHYLLGQSGSFPSGESLAATETGLIAKVRSKQRHFGESWEEVIRLSFQMMGDERGEVMTSETIWADPESRSESEHVDAVMKRKALGVPPQQLWEDLGYTQTQIKRFRQMLAEIAVTQAIAQPASPQVSTDFQDVEEDDLTIEEPSEEE